MYLILLLIGCPEPIVYQNSTLQPPDTKHMVRIDDATHRQGGFWIDAFEFPNVPNQRPLTSTSFSQAKEACADTGKRLCTASEWRRACLGSDNLRFGYGDTYERERCHTASTLISGHTSLMNAQEWTVESGSKQYCQSEGVFDLIGNVEEWVLDDWQGRPGSLEGGAWYTYTEYADCSGGYSRQPDYRTPLNRPVYSAGFRCCWTPEPPTKGDIVQDSELRIQPKDVMPSYNSDLEREIQVGVWMDIFEYPNQPNASPLTGVSWTDANTLCSTAGKRLCTATEWEQACSGPHGWIYPYGNTYIDGLCDIDNSDGSTSGTFLGCQSSFGIQDMVGSVWEWTDTTLDATVLKNGPNVTLKEIRGGSWFVEHSKGVCAPSDGYPLAPTTANHPDVGFRCCRGEQATKAPSTSDLHRVDSIQCPETMIAVRGYCIDQFEYPNLKGVQPIADATLTMAKQACLDHGKHLCTDEEWLQACEGEERRRWPYGHTYIERACNDHGWVDTETMGSAQNSGSFSRCATPDGVFDMSSNLWEWTDDTVPTMRGGAWQLSAGLGQCRSNTKPSESYHSGESGFRCCASKQEAQRLLTD